MRGLPGPLRTPSVRGGGGGGGGGGGELGESILPPPPAACGDDIAIAVAVGTKAAGAGAAGGGEVDPIVKVAVCCCKASRGCCELVMPACTGGTAALRCLINDGKMIKITIISISILRNELP